MPDLTITIDPAGIDALVAKLGRAVALATLEAPMQRSLSRMQTTLVHYPPQSHRKQPAKTRKQQIKQIMLAKAGKIPYRRRGADGLAGAWKAEVVDTAGGIEGILSNAVVSPEGTHYAALVQGQPGDQAAYFQGSAWPTVTSVVAQHEVAIQDDFAATIQRALEG